MIRTVNRRLILDFFVMERKGWVGFGSICWIRGDIYISIYRGLLFKWLSIDGGFMEVGYENREGF